MAGKAESVGGGQCYIPASFDTAHNGYSDAPDPAASDYSNPRRVLFLSVLHQALSDARNPTARSSGASSALPDDREEAIRFLTVERGARARWRRTICTLVGLDPVAFEESVRAESKNWPLLSDLNSSDRRQTYSSRHRRSEGRSDADKRREASRLAMQRKRARERAQPESYSRRALLVGGNVTFPTLRDR